METIRRVRIQGGKNSRRGAQLPENEQGEYREERGGGEPMQKKRDVTLQQKSRADEVRRGSRGKKR